MAKTAIGANPDISLGILKQRTAAGVTQSILHLVTGQRTFPPVAHTSVGRYPDATVFALQKDTDVVVREALADCQVFELAIQQAKRAIAIGTEPESARGI